MAWSGLGVEEPLQGKWVRRFFQRSPAPNGWFPFGFSQKRHLKRTPSIGIISKPRGTRKEGSEKFETYCGWLRDVLLAPLENHG